MRFPRRSAAVHEVPLGDGLVLHDSVQNLVHVLNPSARVVWEACDGRTSTDEVVATLADVTGLEVDEIDADIVSYVDDLRNRGLVGRDHAPPLPDRGSVPTVDSGTRGTWLSRSYAILDELAAIRTDDPGLAGLADGLLGSLASDGPATVIWDVVRDDHGMLRLVGRGHDQRLITPEAVAGALPSLFNRVAAASTTCLGLHAGAVRHPSGTIVALPGVSGAGKSTLTAALVRAGWDYVTDEAVGIRLDGGELVAYPKPLSLDAVSRELLGLPAGGDLVTPDELRPGSAVAVGVLGAVDRFVLARRGPGLSPVRRLSPEDAVTALAEHCLNLGTVGHAGLRQLVRLAAEVPCVAFEYPDLASAVTVLR